MEPESTDINCDASLPNAAAVSASAAVTTHEVRRSFMTNFSFECALGFSAALRSANSVTSSDAEEIVRGTRLDIFNHAFTSAYRWRREWNRECSKRCNGSIMLT